MKLSRARERQQFKLPLSVTFNAARKREEAAIYDCVLELRRRGHRVYRAGYHGQHILHTVDGRACTTDRLKLLVRSAPVKLESYANGEFD